MPNIIMKLPKILLLFLFFTKLLISQNLKDNFVHLSIEQGLPSTIVLDLLQDLKDIHPNLPVILCTAYPVFEHDMKSKAADYYVTKSSNLQELKSIIQMAIRGEDSAQSAKTRSRLREQEWTPPGAEHDFPLAGPRTIMGGNDHFRITGYQ